VIEIELEPSGTSRARSAPEGMGSPAMISLFVLILLSENEIPGDAETYIAPQKRSSDRAKRTTFDHIKILLLN